MKKYTCAICEKKIQLLAQHLRKHNLNIDEYFLRFPNEQEKYSEYKDSVKFLRQSKSPNCIEFYLAKGLTEAQAEKALEEHRSKLPFRNRKDFRRNQYGYWKNKGLTDEEIKEQIRLFQSNSEQSYIEKYGEEIGKEKYSAFLESLNKRKDTEISNIVEEYGVTTEDANEIFCDRRISSSPRRKEYWLKKGLTEQEAIDAVNNFQKSVSPRCVEYWGKLGYSSEDSMKKVSEWQDFISIPRIMQVKNISFEDAVDLQDKWFSRYIENHKNREYDYLDFKKYSKIVRKISNRYYCLYKDIIDPDNIRGVDFHLDHRLSIINGFMANLPIEIVGHVINIRVITSTKNLIKGSKSDLSIEELIEEYNENKDKYKAYPNKRR